MIIRTYQYTSFNVTEYTINGQLAFKEYSFGTLYIFVDGREIQYILSEPNEIIPYRSTDWAKVWESYL